MIEVQRYFVFMYLIILHNVVYHFTLPVNVTLFCHGAQSWIPN